MFGFVLNLTLLQLSVVVVAVDMVLASTLFVASLRPTSAVVAFGVFVCVWGRGSSSGTIELKGFGSHSFNVVVVSSSSLHC